MTSEISLFNLDPVLSVLSFGVALSCIPLGWWWWRNKGSSPLHHQRGLALLALFLTFDLVLFGAFTRLTDSGLGCPDWPGCYGHSSPLGAHQSIQSAQDILPSGPVTHSKAWIEMIHRYLATSVGTLLVVLCALAWLHRHRNRQLGRSPAYSPWLPSISLVWVCTVGLFGALTVTLKLQPAIVTLHLMGALVLLALLTIQVVDLQVRSNTLNVKDGAPYLSALALLLLGLLGVQVALGGWVSTNYAVLACQTFPTCNGQWWPQMNFEQGFTIWRRLGYTHTNELLSFDALVAIHYVHRLFAYLVLAITWLYGWLLFKSGHTKIAKIILAISFMQLLTGVANVLLKWPLPIALLHTGGAAGLVVTLTWQLRLHAAQKRAISP